MTRLTNEQRAACHANLRRYDGNRNCDMYQMHPKYEGMKNDPWYKRFRGWCDWCTHAPREKTWNALVHRSWDYDGWGN